MTATSLIRLVPVPGQSYHIVVDGSNVSRKVGTIFLRIRQTVIVPKEAITIVQAMELDFNSIAGKQYQLQRSSDLTNWVAEGNPFPGTGNLMPILVSTAGRTHDAFRFAILP